MLFSYLYSSQEGNGSVSMTLVHDADFPAFNGNIKHVSTIFDRNESLPPSPQTDSNII